ncbi:DUF6290 family protein [Leuconostoc rapi]|uniref:DUF6290 family protein n=1 Tax=Leuconostoc rapi TaxID=1406906 RepID=UPI0019592015|nr:DUF6290 family protein [Leuconostoc rapi]MBM7435342.1 putative DNA-binding protein [Leuconostoc rapi]
MTTYATSIRFDDTLMENVKAYAHNQHISTSKFIEQTVAEKITDLMDYQIAENAYQAWEADNFKTTSLNDFLTEFDLTDLTDND